MDSRFSLYNQVVQSQYTTLKELDTRLSFKTNIQLVYPIYLVHLELYLPECRFVFCMCEIINCLSLAACTLFQHGNGRINQCPFRPC